jgi:hypothetical protein
MTEFTDWQPIENAPLDRDLELAVIDADGVHPLIFPCRRTIDRGWINVGTGRPIRISPTHWRDWPT